MIYMQFLCSDYVNDSDFKSGVAGYTMMIIYSVNIVVNIVIGFIEFLRPTFLKLKRWKYQRDNKKKVQGSQLQQLGKKNVTASKL